jgi:hypothetical protein
VIDVPPFTTTFGDDTVYVRALPGTVPPDSWMKLTVIGFVALW